MALPLVKLTKGIHVLHLFYRIDRLRWTQLPAGHSGQALAKLEALCAANAAPSSRHWNDDPASVAVKENVAESDVTVPDGPAVMLVSGGIVSVDVVESVLSTTLSTTTAKGCDLTSLPIWTLATGEEPRVAVVVW